MLNIRPLTIVSRNGCTCYMICKREILAPYVINHHIKAGQTITRDRTLTRLAPKSIKC